MFEQSVSHRQRISEDNFTSRNKVDNPKTVFNPFMFSGPIENQDKSLVENEYEDQVSPEIPAV